MESLLRNGAPPLVIGHRGACAVAPENTMPAFEAAWRAGARWIETDVQPAADAVPVLIHDEHVDRTTDGSGSVRGLSSGDLAGLDAGSWFDESFAGTRIPRLADLLAALPADRRVLLEIKGDHTPDQVRRIVAEIRSGRAADRVFLESFEVPALERLREILPDQPVGLLVERIGDDPVGQCRRLGAVAYNPDVTELLRRPEVVAHLHRAGIALQPWTADVPDQWAALTELGVDGIITNDPGALIAWQADSP